MLAGSGCATTQPTGGDDPCATATFCCAAAVILPVFLCVESIRLTRAAPMAADAELPPLLAEPTGDTVSTSAPSPSGIPLVF